jgi:uncharacterized membrane protein YczE
MPSRLTARLIQLSWGLALYGLSVGLMVRSNLGLNPWDVFHQGLAERSGLSLGTIIVIIGAAVLLLWIPLRQRPGIGTIANVFLIGIWTDVSLWLIEPVQSLWLAWAMLLGGIFLNGVAGGAYIGAGLGPGPRDGLMTGLVKRTGKSVRLIRTGLEVVVVAAGWMLGGTLGLGTLLYALAIGSIVHRMLPIFTVSDERVTPVAAPASDPDCCQQLR